MANCLICLNEFESDTKLHRHFRSHKITVEEYYTKFFPKKDKFTGEPIGFKNKEHYFSHDFNHKDNFHFWFSRQNKDEQRKYCLEYLAKRKTDKSLLYAPSEVECKSLYLPSFSYMTQLFDSFYGELLNMGYLIKYEPYYEIDEVICNQTPTILIDTREQKPLEFRWGTEIATLNFGDYSCIYRNDEGEGVESSDVFIERKALADFVSSFGSGYERLKSEFERSRNKGGRLVVLVESDMANALNFKGLFYSPRGMKVTPEFVFHNVRDLIQEFPNVQFLFVYNRKKASDIIQKIFASKGALLKFDLQLSYEKGLI